MRGRGFTAPALLLSDQLLRTGTHRLACDHMVKDFYKKLLDNLSDAVYFVDKDRSIQYWNKGAEVLTGYEASEIVGRHCFDNLLMHVDHGGANMCKHVCPLAQSMARCKLQEGEIFLRHKDGHRIPVLVKATPIQDENGQVIGAVEVFQDNSSKVAITQRIAELQKMALLDPLTELGNRRYIEAHLQGALDQMRRYGWPCGVLFVDIDHFKDINDIHGHEVGDRALRMVARTLLNTARSFDFVGRWGGEEFVVVLVNVGDEDRLVSIADRVRVLLGASSLTAGSSRVRLTVSIGAALAHEDDSLDSLITKADELMYHSKRTGRNRVTTRLDASLD